jgi:hypothetical protein
VADIADTLADAAQHLELAVSELGSDSGAQDNVRDALSSCLATLRVVGSEAERAASGTADLIGLAARASENVDLAGLFLERQEEAGESGTDALRSALFHTRRALDYFQRFLADLTDRTRSLDRDRNRQEFLSG